MGKYESVGKAIRLFDEIRRDFVTGDSERDGISSIIRDLTEISKDIRYGGEFNGNFESVARNLNRCANRECSVCGYRGTNGGECARAIKNDGAAAIRQLERKIELMKQQIDDMRGDVWPEDEYPPREETEPAEWQKEIMRAEDGKIQI